jgi:hypothetical protein
MSQLEVEQAALKLPVGARAALAQKLLESLEQSALSDTTSSIPDWVGIGKSDASLSVRDEEILKNEWK